MTWRSIDANTDSGAQDLLAEPWGTHSPNALQRLLIAVTQRTVLQRGQLRASMTKLIMSLGRPLDITFRDCRFRIEARNNLIETGLLTRPSYNASEIEFLQQAMGVAGVAGVAVDIGCNVGLYSLPLAQKGGAKSRILAIDANPEMTAHLVFNALASGLTNIETVTVAVGGHEARANLQIAKDNVAIVKVEESTSGSVQMMPLTRILADAGITRVDSLKIDIEGHEDAALVPFLQQASGDLLPTRIVIERAGPDGDYPGSVREFDRLGYQLVGRTRNNSMYELPQNCGLKG